MHFQLKHDLVENKLSKSLNWNAMRFSFLLVSANILSNANLSTTFKKLLSKTTCLFWDSWALLGRFGQSSTPYTHRPRHRPWCTWKYHAGLSIAHAYTFVTKEYKLATKVMLSCSVPAGCLYSFSCQQTLIYITDLPQKNNLFAKLDMHFSRMWQSRPLCCCTVADDASHFTWQPNPTTTTSCLTPTDYFLQKLITVLKIKKE